MAGYWDAVVEHDRRMQDAAKAAVVEFLFDDTGKVWLNIDGKCAVRIGEVTNVIVTAPKEQWSNNFEFADGHLVGVKDRRSRPQRARGEGEGTAESTES